MFTIDKSTLADAGPNRRASRNCYYTGQTVCWTIRYDLTDQIINVSRKKDAILIARLMNEHFPKYDGKFDIMIRLRRLALEHNLPELDQLIDVREV